MSPEQLVTLSNFLNTQANLPVDIQLIAEELKTTLTPVVEPTPVEEVPVEPEVETPIVPSEE